MADFTKLLALLLCCIALQTSCARKTYQHTERTADTIIVHKTDSVVIRDTIMTISKMETADSVTERLTTFVVVDTAGNVITKSVYRDRSVYHNKDALSSNTHSTESVNKQNNAKSKVSVRDAEIKVEKPPAWTKPFRMFFVPFCFIAIGVLYYYHTYKKRK